VGETTQEVTPAELFSFDERRRVVVSFIDAYLRGSVRVSYWSAADITGATVSLSTGLPISGAEKAQYKKTFHDLLGLACGMGDPTPSSAQVSNAIDTLFRMVVSFRTGEFLEGEFLSVPNVEARMNSLEARVSSIEKLFEELQLRLKIEESR
jgi:hypothetical protein